VALLKIGYHHTHSDSAVYVCQIQQDVIILVIHIDNFLSFSKTQLGLKSAQKQLHKTFEMKEEDPNWLMGFFLVKTPLLKQSPLITHSTSIQSSGGLTCMNEKPQRYL
jgi:hypothetical protein